MNTLKTADYIVFVIYFLLIVGYGYYIYKKKKKTDTSRDFFLAEGSLTWWAIGASLIASNISAEHFIGMSGSGFAIGSCHIYIRMDGCNNTDFCSMVHHSTLPQK
jgi:SSS family solute:Na+ symporter